MSADCLFLTKTLKTISERSLHILPLSEWINELHPRLYKSRFINNSRK